MIDKYALCVSDKLRPRDCRRRWRLIKGRVEIATVQMTLNENTWLTDDIYNALIENGNRLRSAKTLEEESLVPVILVEHNSAKWLLVSIDPAYSYMAYGLCDLGMGFPELGSVEIQTLVDVAHKSPLWDSAPKYRILQYADMARQSGHIVLSNHLSGQIAYRYN